MSQVISMGQNDSGAQRLTGARSKGTRPYSAERSCGGYAKRGSAHMRQIALVKRNISLGNTRHS
jgi:hypothetical protein